MIRFLMSCTAAVLLIAAPVAASAATSAAKPARTTMAKPVAAKPAKKVAGKPAPRRDAGSPAIDALNDQSLARARGGQ